MCAVGQIRVSLVRLPSLYKL